MDFIKPEIGLIFWTTLCFLITFFLLKKMGWTPILKTLSEREETIDNAIAEAEKAREEMANMKADNDKLIQQAREERDEMLTEARNTRESIVAKARTEAKEEAARVMAKAREDIRNDKLAAQTEVKNMVAQLSIEIAEKMMKERLSDDEKQKALVNNLIEDLNLN